MWERIEAWLRGRPVVVDTVLVAVLALVPMSNALISSPASLRDAALFAPLVLRRVAPVASFATVSLLLWGQLFVTDYPLFGDVALLFALYAIAAYGPSWARWGGLAIGFLGALLAVTDWQVETETIAQLAGLGAVVLFCWTLGSLMRTRRAYVAGLEDRALRLKREAAQQAQLAASAERARIAREMHDVVAHSLSVIVVQADEAAYATTRRPEAATDALRTISVTGRESLAQMRRLLGLLRDGPAVELAPLPSAGDLPDLIGQVQQSGLQVTLTRSPDLDRIDPTTGLTVYRIVQEALTNTLRHGGPGATATVHVDTAHDRVVVRVDDDGRGGTATGDGIGHGIAGMRERIAVHSGEIEAGPRPGGGFRVTATIPFPTGEGLA